MTYYLRFFVVTFFLSAFAPVLEAAPVKSSQNIVLSVEASSFSPRYQFQNTFPKVNNPKVQRMIYMYTVGRLRSTLLRGIKRSGYYLPMIRRILREEGVPIQLAYMVPIESNFKIRSRSRKSAVGLWQFIAPTGRHYGLRINRWVDQRKDPLLSTRAAARYLGHLYKLFGNWELALAAYNSGEGRVLRSIAQAKRQHKATDFWSLKLPRETQNYVPAILAMRHIYENAKKYNVENIRTQAPMDEQRIKLPVAYPLQEIAQRSGVPFGKLLNSNIALYRGVPPLTQEYYILYLPEKSYNKLQLSLKKEPNPRTPWGRAYAKFLNNSPKMTSSLEKYGDASYVRVRPGSNLSFIAQRYGSTTYRLKKWNGLDDKSLLQINQRIKIYQPNWKVFSDVAKHQAALARAAKYRFIRVPKNTTLSHLAYRYKTSVRQLMKWNHLKKPSDLRADQKIIVASLKKPAKQKQRRIQVASKNQVHRTIRVPKGATLSHLAFRHDTSVQQLMAWNNLNRATDLRMNQKLIVGVSAPVNQTQHHTIRVRSGDTLWGIAQRYQTSVKRLLALNEINPVSFLRPNQKLIVPAPTSNPPRSS